MIPNWGARGEAALAGAPVGEVRSRLKAPLPKELAFTRVGAEGEEDGSPLPMEAFRLLACSFPPLTPAHVHKNPCQKHTTRMLFSLKEVKSSTSIAPQARNSRW